MKRQNERMTAVIDHEEATERAVAALLLDAAAACRTGQDGSDMNRDTRDQRAIDEMEVHGRR